MRTTVLFCLVAFAAAATPKSLSARQVIPLLRGGQITWIDCRGAKPFKAGHIPRAIDGSVDEKRLDSLLPENKKAVIVLYGKDPSDRSWKKIGATVGTLGYTSIRYFSDGLAGWVKMRGPLERGAMPASGGGAKVAGAEYFQNRPYLIHVPPIDSNVKPILFVWCHPGSGDPKPEFTWWKQSKLFKTNTILLAPKAVQRGWSARNDAKWMTALLKDVIAKHGIEQVVFGGHSSGGFFTSDYGFANRENFTALILACAHHFRPMPKAGKAAPQVIIYGSPNDRVAPWAKVQATATEAQKQGYTTDLVQDNMGHSVGTKLQQRVKKLLQDLRKPAAEANK